MSLLVFARNSPLQHPENDPFVSGWAGVRWLPLVGVLIGFPAPK